MKKLPLIPTLLVALAVVAMIGAGFWQLDHWHKHLALKERYEEARVAPPIAFPAHPSAQDRDTYLFRKSSGYCAYVLGWSATAGRNLKGEGGYRHVASCFMGDADAAPMAVDIGWSRSPDNPQWQGGQVNGVISGDNDNIIRLVADEAAPGLEVSAPPSDDSIPHANSLGYTYQWFAFAVIALFIYILALRKRAR